MLIEGTHDEMTLFKLRCVKQQYCENCVLWPWCERDKNPDDASRTIGLKLVEINTGFSHGMYTALITDGGNAHGKDNQ